MATDLVQFLLHQAGQSYFGVASLHNGVPQFRNVYILALAAGLSRPGKSQEGPRTGQDGTGPRDPESPGTNKSQDLTSSKVPGLFLKVPGLPGPFFIIYL